jgi:RNA polymerase sigma factor (sigma-70 family)
MTARRARWEKTDLIPLFLAKKRRLLQMASQITGCPCLAEDIVQDTMVKLCESGIDERVQCPTAYVFRMVRNLSIDCARRRKKDREFSGPEEDGTELMASCPCPEMQILRCQALRLIVSALQELPERTRHAFQLHRIDGIPQREIASQMRVSPTLVNFMIRDAHNYCRLKLLSNKIDGDLVPQPAGRQPPKARSRRLSSNAVQHPDSEFELQGENGG